MLKTVFKLLERTSFYDIFCIFIAISRNRIDTIFYSSFLSFLLIKSYVLNLFGVNSIDQKLSIMKAIKTHLKTVVLIFAALILLQGCTVYKSANVTLEEAVKSQTKVKIKTKDIQSLKFKRLEFEDGKYYGVKKFKGDIIKMSLDENNLISVRLKNKTLSIILPIAIPIVLLGIISNCSIGGGYICWE